VCQYRPLPAPRDFYSPTAAFSRLKKGIAAYNLGIGKAGAKLSKSERRGSGPGFSGAGRAGGGHSEERVDGGLRGFSAGADPRPPSGRSNWPVWTIRFQIAVEAGGSVPAPWHGAATAFA